MKKNPPKDDSDSDQENNKIIANPVSQVNSKLGIYFQASAQWIKTLTIRLGTLQISNKFLL
jgi:hypothetical protein